VQAAFKQVNEYSQITIRAIQESDAAACLKAEGGRFRHNRHGEFVDEYSMAQLLP
jgi:hypothetical protein